MAPGLGHFSTGNLQSPLDRLKKGTDSPGPWASFFAPRPNSNEPVFLVPNEWAKFFTSVLMSPKHFAQGKDLIQSKALLDCINSADDDSNNFALSLPKKCPVEKAPICFLQESVHETAVEVNVVASEAPPVENDTVTQKNKGKIDKGKIGPVLVESEVRRSPRVKLAKNGFKNPVCKDLNCIGCTSKPPPLTTKAIRKLSSSLCDVDCSLVSDSALRSVKMAGAPNKKKKEARKDNLKAKKTPGDSSSSKPEGPKKDDAEA